MDNLYEKSQLTDQELMLVNSDVEKNAKSPVVAYLLWWFTGFMGGHRYYFGKTGSAVAMTLIFWLLVWVFGLGALINGIWMLVDVFLIHGWIVDDKSDKEKQAINDIFMRKQMRQNRAQEPVQAAQSAEPEASAATTADTDATPSNDPVSHA
ncbi:TM2 domain-containing protein [Levilactobacillus yonginensis]|uniref:TM2 domain-containing protein n=1 Tax=Levilactobacillus yonginensis TaxID=1054041 RepID=UPI00345C693F